MGEYPIDVIQQLYSGDSVQNVAMATAMILYNAGVGGNPGDNIIADIDHGIRNGSSWEDLVLAASEVLNDTD